MRTGQRNEQEKDGNTKKGEAPIIFFLVCRDTTAASFHWISHFSADWIARQV